MKKFTGLKYLLSTVLLAGISIMVLYSGRAKENEMASVEISSEATAESEVAFDKMMDVLSHKRCVNCHPSDRSPKQGEDSHPHLFGIQGGGSVACNTCHQESNNNYSGVPGAPDWALAPPSMAWEGLSRIEIAQSMMDRSKNGNRSAEDIMHHLTEHELVLWAWEPGINAEGIPREKPPVPKEEYIAAVKEWIEAGAIIPSE